MRIKIDVEKAIGQNAGKIYTELSKYSSLQQINLIEKTNLNDHDFYFALGWLARENKIRKDDETFALGETNLTSKIGVHAGRVWESLHVSGELDISSIAQSTHLEEKDVYAALGWLAREGKIAEQKIVPAQHQVPYVSSFTQSEETDAPLPLWLINDEEITREKIKFRNQLKFRLK